MATNPTLSSGRGSTPFIILFVLGAIVLVGLLLLVSLRLAIWIGTLLLLTFIVLLAGRVFTEDKNWLGILVDERKKMSLSRFQTILWSVLILSAFLAAAIANLLGANNPTGALSIDIPPELLGILGISVTSLAGAPLILNNKKPDQVDTNVDGGRPALRDMFKGDDVANCNYVDLSKVQMFYFTIILVLAYGAALVALFMVVDPRHPAISAFPALNPAIVGLFGISHAGYLTYKAVPRDQSTGISQAPADQTTPADQTSAASSVSPDPQAPQTSVQN